MNRRKVLDQELADLAYVHKLMRNLFPKNNDCASSEDLEEAVKELTQFSLTTKLQVRLFLKKHRRPLLELDKEPLGTDEHRLLRNELGDQQYLDSVWRQYWFCYPALIREALLLEFGSKYEEFANQRDGI